jgi:signal transduction histidine kinase
VAGSTPLEPTDERLGSDRSHPPATEPTAAADRVPLLLVDDRPANLLALEGILASPEYEIISVGSGAEAVEAFRLRDFALTLLDVQMPTMSGFETALQMRRVALREERDAPIIFVTAGGDHTIDIPEAYAQGAVDFLQKPLDVDVIRAKIATFAQFFRSKERLRRRLESALRAREEQLAVVAHDLRNPLSTVLLAASQIENLAASSSTGERSAKAARSIVRAVGRMTRLVGDLLDVAKLDAGQALPLELEPQDVAQLVRIAIEGNETLARSRLLTLTMDAERDVVVQCDGERIQQVLANLIDNAIKFTREGGTIHVHARRTDDGAIVSVRDSGTGITESQLRHIFEKYWQDDARPKRGAGLGLAIARGVVNAHGGRIWAETALGIGSTFHFTLASAPPTPAAKDAR